MNKRWACRAWLAGLCAVTALTAASADDIRSWTDADGNVHFADKYAAPEQSRPVELGEGTYIDMDVPALPAPPTSAADAANDKPAAAVRTRPCTPLIEEMIDPVSGMHNTRDTGRCQEDAPLAGTVEAYPVYVPSCATHSGRKASGCVRPHPHPHPKPPPKPPVTPPVSKPVSPAAPHPFNQSPVDFSR